MASILHATGSFMLSVYLPIVETAYIFLVVDIIATVDLDVLVCIDGIHNGLIDFT